MLQCPRVWIDHQCVDCTAHVRGCMRAERPGSRERRSKAAFLPCPCPLFSVPDRGVTRARQRLLERGSCSSAHESCLATLCDAACAPLVGALLLRRLRVDLKLRGSCTIVIRGNSVLMNMVKFSLLFATACLLRLGGSAGAGQWNTLDQAHMSNVMDVTVSSNGVDVAYVVAGTAGPAHNLSATGWVGDERQTTPFPYRRLCLRRLATAGNGTPSDCRGQCSVVSPSTPTPWRSSNSRPPPPPTRRPGVLVRRLLMLGRLEREPGADASAPFAVLPFCATASAGCSSPRFSPDATSLAFLSNGALFVTRAGAGSWGTPARVATNGSVLFFDWWVWPETQ